MSTSLATRLLSAAALGAAVTLSVALPASAVDLADPKVTTDGGKQVIQTRTASTGSTGSKFVPKGGEPVDDFPEGEPKAGDGFLFTEDLRQDGVRVGTDSGRCTFSGDKGTPLICEVTVTFPKGTIGVKGEIHEGEPEILQLVSGTGAYSGIKGTVTVVDVNDDVSDLTFRFVTRAGDGTQVDLVPSGGAATGGGLAGDGTTTGLLGLGAAAVAAGAGLLGFGRRAGRRSH